MTIATRTDTTVAATVTQTSLVNALITAFTSAGFATAIDNYTSGTDRILVYKVDVDASKTFGSNFLRIRITSALQVLQQIMTGWNTTTKVATNGSTEVSMGTFVTTSSIQLVALSAGLEGKFVACTQGTVFMLLGLLIPSERPTWWDLNSWSWGFIFISTTLLALRSSTRFPYSSSEYEFLSSTRMSNFNPQTNRRDVLSGAVLLTSGNAGIAGKSSGDIGLGCGVGSARYDTLSFPPDTRQFLLINNTASGFAMRVQ
ncbi:hypothetical protein [Brunnivagina elsteri]|uniref:Uncharacterized protein n=1 Tax=Brunnivagina elsteri CCALA 953 TaxID=987040 RepID=A0A2A2TGU4_9CYAN|nr:hypothetical protein [Calothrix elsteri]PAX52855.1 hypothetical protein CK510_17000 [Calothrix elsteri CCALA 953]